MILVALLVCLFAIGMAGLLNFFKYRSNAERIIKERLVVTGNSIESSIQSSLALGIQFADIGTLPGTMERERATDDMILSVDVFDADGKMLYSTDRLRATRSVPSTWLAAARQANGADWFVRDGNESAASNAIKNNFGLLIGHVALRYSEEQLRASTNTVARELALSTFGVFAAAATLASLALLGVMHKLGRDVGAVEAALHSGDPLQSSESVRKGPFGRALRRFFESVRSADAEIAQLRGSLEQGVKR
jgi:hypothetical protein